MFLLLLNDIVFVLTSFPLKIHIFPLLIQTNIIQFLYYIKTDPNVYEYG